MKENHVCPQLGLTKRLTVISATILLGCALPQAIAGRLWTDREGRTVHGELINSENDEIRIRRRDDGREFSLAVTLLGERDRHYAHIRSLERNAPGVENKTPQWLSAEATRKILDAVAELVEQKHAHAAVSRHDIHRLLREHHDSVSGDLTLNEVLFLIQSILAPIGDGHSGIDIDGGVARNAMRGVLYGDQMEYLPFRLQSLGERPADPVIGVEADRSNLLDPRHPVVLEIDGVPIREWQEQVSAHLPAGSPAFMRRSAVRELRSLWRWRQLMELPREPIVEVTLGNIDGSSQVTVSRPTRSGRLDVGTWPRTESRLVGADIGYLRIPTMTTSDEDLDNIRSWMERFRETRGLIIDVRGNGGGQRHVIQLMGGYLLAPEQTPVVYTAVRPRLIDGRQMSSRIERRMSDRHLYPLDHSHWTSMEREAIDTFAREFSPRPEADNTRFGPLHFAVLTHGGDERTYYYDRPVIVLMDGDCFSATDLFVHAMSLLPNVTLMGLPTSGSSGAPLTWETPIHGIGLVLSSMISYRSDGTMFDNGQSQEPEIRVAPTPDCLLGRSDRMLDAALARISGTGDE